MDKGKRGAPAPHGEQKQHAVASQLLIDHFDGNAYVQRDIHNNSIILHLSICSNTIKTTGAALLEIMKPPQSLPMQMAERLLELS